MSDDTMHDDSDLWTSPVQNAPLPTRPKTPRTPKTPKTPKTPTSQQAPPAGPVDREAALRRELDGVRNINEVIEGVISTLQRAGGNMEVVSKTVSNASTLLNTWTRILSQTEHNQRLLLNPGFKGATEDLAEMEAEEQRRQQALKRRVAEEEQRREEARRRREEEEVRRQLAASAPSRGTRSAVGTRGARGRPRSASRVASASVSTRSTEAGGTSMSTSTSTSTGSSRGRGTSGIARGYGAGRSRYGTAK